MFSYLDECYMVFVRQIGKEHKRQPERSLVACGTYHEALMVRRENEAPDRKCIIRYVGPTGGGD